MTSEQLEKMQKVWPIVNYLPPKTMGVLSPEGFKKLYDMFGAVQSAVRLIEIRDAQIVELKGHIGYSVQKNLDDIEMNWGKQ